MAQLNAKAAATLTEPCYLILFTPSVLAEGGYTQTIPADQYWSQYSKGQITLPLGLDRAFVPVLPAIWYCLHLPRTRFDLIKLHAKGLKESQRLHLPHRLVLVPVPYPPALPPILNNGLPKILIVQDDLLDSALALARELDHVVEVTPLSSLDSSRLAHHWKALHLALGLDRPQFIRPTRLIANQEIRPALLPVHFVARQLFAGSDDNVPADFTSQAKVLEYASYSQTVLSAIAKLEAAGTPPAEAERIYPAELERQSEQFQCPVSVGMPGVSPKSAVRLFEKSLRRVGILSNSEDAVIETSVLGFLVAHRALSRAGVGFVSRPLGDEPFALLDTLERLWAGGPLRPRAVWKLLGRIGDILSRHFTEEECAVMSHASSLTSFSEFPLGLAILPKGTSPLCCRVPIAYRPIVPLTRALQFELTWVPTINLRGKLKVLIAECIPPDNVVGHLSRTGWAVGTKSLVALPNVECRAHDVRTLDDMRTALREDTYNILVISAHGGTDGNRTGFVCGKDLVVEQEIGPLPPIVCLSACQVSPRGAGTVNVTDLMFRQGAIVVLGTLVPIEVRRNAILMARLFANIAAAIEDPSQRQSFEEVWHFTSTSNAFNDILTANPRLAEWARGESPEESVVQEFMVRRSPGRLRKSHIYEDSEAVLEEIARDRGILEKFRSWIRSQGYLPESIFYVLLGWPERVLLHDREFARVVDSFSAEG